MRPCRCMVDAFTRDLHLCCHPCFLAVYCTYVRHCVPNTGCSVHASFWPCLNPITVHTAVHFKWLSIAFKECGVCLDPEPEKPGRLFKWITCWHASDHPAPVGCWIDLLETCIHCSSTGQARVSCRRRQLAPVTVCTVSAVPPTRVPTWR